MATIRRDYTQRDFSTLLDALNLYMQQNYPNIHANFQSETEASRIIAELTAFIGDNLSFYIDQAFNELHIDSVTDRNNMVRLCKLIGYSLRNRTAATVTLTCTKSATTQDVTIYKGTNVSVNDGSVSFVVEDDTIITGATTSFTLDVMQGYLTYDNFKGDATPNQILQTSKSGLAENADIEVVVGSGSSAVVWTQVDNVFEAPCTNSYHIEVQSDLSVKIFFGDDTYGSIPGLYEPIVVTYIVTEGAAGNIPANSIQTSIQGKTTNGINVSINVKNDSAASGGEDEETIEEARINAPLSLKANDRLVTESDYTVYCNDYPGVAKSRVVATPSVNILDVYIVADGYEAPSAGLKADLLVDINERKMAGVVVYVNDPDFVYVDLDCDLYVKSNYNKSAVALEVIAALDEFFEPADPNASDINFGRSVYFSDIVGLIENITGVDYVDTNKLTRVPTLNYTDWHGTPAFSSLSVNAGCINNETFTILNLGGGSFSVTGSVTGSHTSGTFGVAYTSDNNEISFTLSVGSSIMGDKVLIRVGKYLGNVILDANEFPKKGTISVNI